VFPPATVGTTAVPAVGGTLAYPLTAAGVRDTLKPVPEYTTPPLTAGTHEYICGIGGPGGAHCNFKGMYQKVVVSAL
jgi:hypothetical protein